LAPLYALKKYSNLTPNPNLLQSTRPTNIITTGPTEYIVATVGDIVEGTINVNYKAIIEVYFRAIIRRSAMFIRSQITSQLGTPLIDKRRYIISFARVYKTLETKRLL